MKTAPVKGVGILGIEKLITISQQVYDSEIHKSLDKIIPSSTDSKRMLEAYINYELQRRTNEKTWKFAKATVDLANHLTLSITATKKCNYMFVCCNFNFSNYQIIRY